MVKSTRPQRGNRRLSPFSSVVTLALWRWRQTGFLLSIIALGMIAAVLIASSIPLFSDMMTTAGLHNTLRSTPDDSEMVATSNTVGLSAASIQAVHDQFETLIQPSLGSYVQAPEFSLTIGDFSLAAPANQYQADYGDSTLYSYFNKFLCWNN